MAILVISSGPTGSYPNAKRRSRVGKIAETYDVCTEVGAKMSKVALNKAPALRVAQWIDDSGRTMPPLTLDQLGTGLKVIFCFQHWCPGCHSAGFPTLQRLVHELAPLGIGFAVVQTVFEGFEENTFDQLQQTQQRYELELPFGHDAIPGSYPTVMEDYKTRGTPWFIIIDREDEVVFSDFHIDADRLIDQVATFSDTSSK